MLGQYIRPPPASWLLAHNIPAPVMHVSFYLLYLEYYIYGGRGVKFEFRAVTVNFYFKNLLKRFPWQNRRKIFFWENIFFFWWSSSATIVILTQPLLGTTFMVYTLSYFHIFPRISLTFTQRFIMHKWTHDCFSQLSLLWSYVCRQ